MTPRRTLAALLALAALAAPASAAAAVPAAPAPTIAGVKPLDGHTVRLLVKTPGDLAPADVEARLGDELAFVDGVQRVGRRTPLRLVLALDTSGSMAGAPIRAAAGAAAQLVAAAGAGDRVGLVTFDSAARVAVPPTADPAHVREALRQLAPRAGTALYDGIGRAAALAGSAPGVRSVVVVLSDGADTSSSLTLARLQRQLRSLGTEVDAVGLTSSSSYTAAALRALTAGAHERLVETDSLAGLAPLAASIAQERLSGTWAVDVPLPASDARTLSLSVRGGPPARVELPAGLTAPGTSFAAHGQLAVVLLGMLAVAVIAFVVLAALARRPAPLSTRLSHYSSEGHGGGHHGPLPFVLALSELLEQRLEGRRAWQWLATLLQRAGVARPVAQVVLGIAAGALVLALLATVVAGPLAAPLAALVAGVLPVLALRFRARRRERQFEEQLPELLAVWSSSLRAGRSFAQALDSIVEQATAPARGEFRIAQHQVRLGVPIEQALDDMARRLGSESFELVVLTTDVQRRVGGNVAEIFDQVATTVRKRQQFAARVKALTSMGRLSAQVLLGMPFALAGLLTLINRGYMMPLFTSRVGHMLLAVAVVMMGAGALVLRRLVRPRAIV